MTLTVGSIFTGIGGLDLGLERAGMEIRWMCEKDEYAARVLMKHWPGITVHRDVREIGSENLEEVDVIAGGFPCQDVSVCGKMEGLDGERSGLFFELWRVVREMGPRYVIMENVAELVNNGLDRVLGQMAESGYDAEWDIISAASVGAEHRRDRIFIVGIRKEGGGGQFGSGPLQEQGRGTPA